MLPDWRLASDDIGSPLIVVEHPKGMTKKTADRLLDFANGGGSLLMTGMGIGQDQRLAKCFGVKIASHPKGPQPLRVDVGDGRHAFEHWLFKLQAVEAETLLEITAADGQSYPLLTRNSVGSGNAYFVPLPLLASHGSQSVPQPVLAEIFERVLPAADRLLTTDAPETVEVVLRRQGQRRIVHLVNMARGEREQFSSGKRRYPLITSLPPVPDCRLTVRMSERPETVHLEPQNTRIDDWHYAAGRLNVNVPSFAVHQIVVVD
jgi:hypothetical protein